MISIEKALDIIRQNIPASQLETVSLLDSLGRVIGEDMFSDIDMPSFDKSAMDGYALRSEDIKLPPVELEVIEIVPAGKVATKELKPGKAIKIMTGAPIPLGADAVIIKEDTQYISSTQTVRCFKRVERAANICFKAEDVKKGEMVISRDTKITPQHIALLSAVGKDKVRVYKYPTITIASSGDELVEITQKPIGAQVRNSNTYSIQAQLNNVGFKVTSLSIVKDEMDSLTKKISQGLRADIFILTGGVSVGDYDIVEEVLKKLGTEILIDQVAIKPGKPFVFGKNKHCLVFGLPGNPVSVFVSTEVFIKEVLSILCNDPGLKNPIIKAILTEPIERTSNRQQYLFARCYLEAETNLWKVEPIKGHGSADIASLSRSNVFIIVPADSPPLPSNSPVSVMVLE
jgi:molybdopterin molybdotransferase